MNTTKKIETRTRFNNVSGGDIKVIEGRINITKMPAAEVPAQIDKVAWCLAMIGVDKLANSPRWLSAVDILVHRRTDLRACEASIVAFGQPCYISTGMADPHGLTKIVSVVFASDESFLTMIQQVTIAA
jgi:hypothetical protein